MKDWLVILKLRQKILNYCQLDWDDEILSFLKTKGE